MTWRELWKSTVTNLRVLLGFSPTPPARSSPAAPSPMAKRKSVTLTVPITSGSRPDATNRAPQNLDLAPARAMAHPTTSLRTRKAPTVPVDVALDAAAFATVKTERTETPPVVANPTPAPELTWTRQGVAQVEQPTMGAPSDPDQFDADDPSDHEYSSNGYGDGGHDDGDGDEDEGVALTTLLESLLFVASEPVEPRQLAQTLGQPLEIIELGLAELADYYQRSLRGLRLQRFNDKVQLVTAPTAAPFIEAFLNLDNSTRLSSPALETLAVIAYRQPVTRAQIEAVRGVDCSGVLRSLMQRGLVAEIGRLEGIGRPILYSVTELFMQHFGLMEMGELPPLEETEADRLWAATVLDEPEVDGQQDAPS